MVRVMSRSMLIMLLGTASLLPLAPGRASAADSPSGGVSPGIAASTSAAAFPSRGMAIVPDTALAGMRGGFSLPNDRGIGIDFGFSIQTLVNGQAVQTLSGDINHLTQQISPAFRQVAPDTVSSALNGQSFSATSQTPLPVSSFSDVRNKANPSGVINTQSSTPTGTTFTSLVPQAGGNGGGVSGQQLYTTIANTVGSAGMSTLIQNPVNGQIIQQTRTLNIDISGMQTQLVNAAQSNHVIQSLLPR
ncbi:MAG TPA: hypothetical protein PLQ37_05160 [Acidiphilium sp.]|nr:hypothetical protein [Acidiphilium sp.]